jgi:hypothetical protein
MFALPLKTEDNLHGIFAEHEMYMMMSVIFTAIFFDFEPTKSFPLRKVAAKLSTMFGKLIEANVKSVTATGFVAKLIDSYRENGNALSDYGVHMVRRLTETGMSPHEIAFSQIMPTAIAMVPNQSQVVCTKTTSLILGRPFTDSGPSSRKSSTITFLMREKFTCQRSTDWQRSIHPSLMRSCYTTPWKASA